MDPSDQNSSPDAEQSISPTAEIVASTDIPMGRRAIYVSISLLIIVGLIWFCTALSSVFTPFFVALSLAYICNPIITWLESKKLGRMAAILIFFIVTSFLVTMLALMVLPIFINEIKDLVANFPLHVERGAEQVREMMGRVQHHLEGHADVKNAFDDNLPALKLQLKDLFADGVEWGITRLRMIGGGIEGVINFLTGMVLTPVFLFFFLKDMDRVSAFVRNSLPYRHRDKILLVLDEIDDSVAAFFRGRLIICLGIYALSALAYGFTGVPYFMIFAFLFGLSTIIPLLNFFVVVPMLVMVWMEHQGIEPVMRIFAVYGILQAIEGFVLTPWILGKKVEMHPVTLIMSFLVWGNLFGFIGLLLAVVITATLKIVFHRVLEEPFERLKQEL